MDDKPIFRTLARSVQRPAVTPFALSPGVLEHRPSGIGAISRRCSTIGGLYLPRPGRAGQVAPLENTGNGHETWLPLAFFVLWQPASDDPARSTGPALRRGSIRAWPCQRLPSGR